MLNDFLQSLGDNGLPEKSLSLEAQKYIDDKDVHSIPDGLISCNYAFKIYIESKLSEDINRDQLENQYIIQHATRPAELSEGILWTNWSELLRFLKAYEPEEPNVCSTPSEGWHICQSRNSRARPEGAEAPSLGHRPRYIERAAMRPEGAKAL